MNPPVLAWRESGLKWWWIAVLAIVADQLTKLWIVDSIPNGGSVYVMSVLNIIHTYNPGAAWSMFANAGGAQRWVFSALAVVVSVVLIWWLRRLALASQKILIAGLTLILGGAIGNVIDRFRLGHVVDFIQVHWNDSYFPAFNVADAAISVGAALVILDALREGQRERRAKAAGGTGTGS
ncbi:MAG TPA: signal peptidase II [Steroidobacteraceae bacterium]|nr:signal peptidase II [Steroidobacteraceae bacterium]